MTGLPLPFPRSTISLGFGAVDGEYYTFSSPHQGVDFSSRSQGVVAGTVIRASGPGRVVRSGVGPQGVSPTMARPNSLSGNSLDVDYGDCITRYMHRPFDSPSPAVGSSVVEGTSLGVVGATGQVSAAHLHLETWEKATGRRVDPARFFDFSRTAGTASPASVPTPTTVTPTTPLEDTMRTIRRPLDGSINFADEMGGESVTAYKTPDIGLAEYLYALDKLAPSIAGLTDREHDIIRAIAERRTGAFVARISATVVAQLSAGVKVDVDEHALAAQLAPLIGKASSNLGDADLSAIAKAVADEQAKRLTK